MMTRLQIMYRAAMVFMVRGAWIWLVVQSLLICMHPD